MARKLSTISAYFDQLPEDPDELHAELDKGLTDGNLVGVNSALRGAQVASQTDGTPPASIKEAQKLDPVAPTKKEMAGADDDKSSQQILYSALLAAVPTVLGAAIGGNKGGEIGATVGVKALQDAEALKKAKEERDYARGVKQQEIGVKVREVAKDEAKLAQEKDLKIMELAQQERLKKIDKQIAGAKNVQDAEGKLRDDFQQNTIVKAHETTTTGISKIREAVRAAQSGKGNSYDDVALVFNFMKTLDPTSVVREGEYKTAENNAGLFEQWGVKISNVLQRKARLTETQRQQLIDAAERQFDGSAHVYDSYVNGIAGIAMRRGLDIRNVVPGFAAGPKTEAPTTVGAAPKPGMKNPLVNEAHAAPAPPPGTVHMSNGTEDFFVPSNLVPQAEADGFKRLDAQAPPPAKPGTRGKYDYGDRGVR